VVLAIGISTTIGLVPLRLHFGLEIAARTQLVGTVLVRVWNGQRHEVCVLATGLEREQRRYLARTAGTRPAIAAAVGLVPQALDPVRVNEMLPGPCGTTT